MEEIQKVFVTWKDINNYVNAVIKDIKDKNLNPSGVYGVPRGGLIIATILSYRLNIPLLMNAAENCIIVDDIADSGRTLIHFTENDTQFNRYYITTMYYKDRSLVKPNFYMKEKGNLWIEFPWESDYEA